jgi:hypothetical protein
LGTSQQISYLSTGIVVGGGGGGVLKFEEALVEE